MLRQLLSTTRGVGGRDMLPDPLDQVDQFNALCEKLSDEDFKKRMVLSFIYNLFIIYYMVKLLKEFSLQMNHCGALGARIVLDEYL